MPRFAANVSLLYTELPFLDRFAAAARDGFGAVECLFPYAHPAAELAARLRDHGLRLLFFNATPRSHPDERGIACLPGREAEFRDSFLRALEYAQALDCPDLHVMSGLVPAALAHEHGRLRETYLANLRWSAAEAAAAGRGVLIEAINPWDMPGFFLARQDEAQAIARDSGAPNVRVMMDLYHCQRVEGDLPALLRRHLPGGRVGHLQVAGVPGRHEPDGGEVDWPVVFALVDRLGYAGWIGAEYHPARGRAPGATAQGLGWLRPWCEPRPARGC